MLKFRTMVAGRRRAQARAARAQRGGAAVQDRRRPAGHPRRALPAPLLARRAAAALQRAARRHEHRRPAAARPGGGPPLLGLAAAPQPRRARRHGPVADPGLEPGPGRGHGHARLPVLRELVAVAGPEDHVQDGAVHPQQAERRVRRAAAPELTLGARRPAAVHVSAAGQAAGPPSTRARLPGLVRPSRRSRSPRWRSRRWRRRRGCWRRARRAGRAGGAPPGRGSS